MQKNFLKKNQHLFIIKLLNKLSIEGEIPQKIKVIYDKITANIISSVQFNCSVVSDSATPWITARQASLSITNIIFSNKKKNESIPSKIRNKTMLLTLTKTPILWPPDEKSWLIWKDLDAGKNWGWEEKGMTEDEMVGWHHRLNGHEFEYTPRVGDGQGGLACCSPWGCKESNMTEWLNWTYHFYLT